MTFAQLVEAVWRRRLVLVIVLAIGAVFNALVAMHVKPSFSAESSVLMVAETSAELARDAPAPVKPILSGDLPMLATTPTVLERVARDLHLADSPAGQQRLAHSIKAHLRSTTSALPGAGGGVLIVGFKDTSAPAAIKGANAVATEVTRFYRDNATERFSALIADLQHQMAQRKGELEPLDLRVQELMAEHPFVLNKGGDSSLNAQFAKLEADRADAGAAALSDQAAADVASRRTTEVRAAALREIAESDPVFRSLRDRYEHDYGELQRIRSQYSTTYPGLAELTHSVDRERAALRTRRQELQSAPPLASSTYATALGDVNTARARAAAGHARVQGLDRALAATQAEMYGTRYNAARLSQLLRQRDTATAAYSVLATRLAEAVANKAEAGSVGSVNVLDRAVFAKPSPFTEPVTLAVTGIVLTVAMAVTMIFILEALYPRLITQTSVEKLYGVPIITSIQ